MIRDPRATETYFTSLVRSRRKKSSASVLKKCANWSARGRGAQREQKKRERAIRRWSGATKQRLSKTAGSHYEHIKKPQGAAHARVPPRQFFAPYTPRVTSTNRGRLFIPRSLSVLPFRPQLMKLPPRLSFFCLSSAFPRLYFSRAHVCIHHNISTSVSVSPGSDQSMQDFCVDLLDWGTALPSMGTKTCRQHREQETTNCCKLRNTNARTSLAEPSLRP